MSHKISSSKLCCHMSVWFIVYKYKYYYPINIKYTFKPYLNASDIQNIFVIENNFSIYIITSDSSNFELYYFIITKVSFW